MIYGADARKKPRLNMWFIAKWSVVLVIVTTAAVVCVWQRNTILSLGYRIGELEKEISVAETEGSKLQVELVRLQKPQRLWTEVREREIGLQEPLARQKVTLLAPRPLRFPEAKRGVARSRSAGRGDGSEVSVVAASSEGSVLRRRR